jgi:hypothetical protein
LARDGSAVAVLPLAIGAALESAPGVRRGQIVQTGPSTIRLRLEPEPGPATEEVWADVLGSLRAYLADQGLADVELVRADEPPAQDRTSGKFRQVIAAPAGTAV